MADYIPNNSPYRELSGDEEEEPLTNFKVAVEAVREKEDDELADPGAIVAGIQEQQAAKKTAKKKKPVEPKYTWTPDVIDALIKEWEVRPIHFNCLHKEYHV